MQEVAQGIGLDKRIGSKFLHAGPGFGGSCFPKDVRALIKTAQDHDVPMRILEAAETVNDTRKRAMARKVSSAFAGVLRGKTVAVLGLTFKPNTDDMREAPSIPLINNVDVAIATDPAAIRDALVRQAASPVRWVETVQKFASEGVTHVIECGPGKVLAGLTKRINGDLTGDAIVDQASLDRILEIVK